MQSLMAKAMGYFYVIIYKALAIDPNQDTQEIELSFMKTETPKPNHYCLASIDVDEQQLTSM